MKEIESCYFKINTSDICDHYKSGRCMASRKDQCPFYDIYTATIDQDFLEKYKKRKMQK